MASNPTILFLKAFSKKIVFMSSLVGTVYQYFPKHYVNGPASSIVEGM